MGSGRRKLGGGSGGGGGGRNQRLLKFHVDSCKNKFSTADDVVHHLRQHHSNYRRMELRTLTRLVHQILSSPSPSSSRQPHKSRRSSSASPGLEEGEDEDSIFINPNQFRKKRKRIDESEERLLQIENDYSKRIDQNLPSTSSSESDSESPPSSSAVSTSEDGIYGEKVEPKIDLMQSMLRESYAAESKGKEKDKEKNIEVEVASSAKNCNEIDIVNSHKVEEDAERLGANGTKERKGKGDVSNAKSVEVKGKDGPRFRDLGGMRSVLEELEMEVFLPLYHPHVPRRLGVNPISGILLHGPPGCGKTKLAHAIATETGVPFYKISATEVVSGVSGTY